MSLLLNIHHQTQQWKTGAADSLLQHTLDCSLLFLKTQDKNDSLELSFEMSCVLADDAFIQNLNHKYRDKDMPTNVLSFPSLSNDANFEMLEECAELGDVIFSFETIAKEAQGFNISFEDHLAHMAIHGFLHLMGYDHIDRVEAEEMELIEAKILTKLGCVNPYSRAL